MAGFGARYYCYNQVLPFTVMVGMEASNVGLNTLFKAATSLGLSHYVLIPYSYAIAVLVLLPSPLIYRKADLPPLSPSVVGKIFLLASIGSSSVLLGYKGIDDTSPTLASAMSNLIPAFAFILAIIFRMEKLALRRSSSQAKIIGTVVSITGAFIVILYKGPAIGNLPHKLSTSLLSSLGSSWSNWVVGGLLLAASYVLTAVWYIVQAHILNEYPAELVMVFIYSIFGGLISGFVGLLAVRDPRAWMFKLDISLGTIVYSGLLNSVLANSIYAWVLHKKGPVYVAMFKPLSIGIAAAMGIIFLGDPPHVGSIVGAVVITLGFYSVMWGKATEEMCKDSKDTDIESSCAGTKTPLLKGSKPGDDSQNTD